MNYFLQDRDQFGETFGTEFMIFEESIFKIVFTKFILFQVEIRYKGQKLQQWSLVTVPGEKTKSAHNLNGLYTSL